MMQLDLARVGKWTEERIFRVDATRLQAYAAAINDHHPRHTGGEQAPPIFACVPVGELVGPAVDGLITPEDRRWTVHEAQDCFFQRSIVAGMVLHTKASSIGVHTRRSGATIVIKTVTHDGRGELVNESYVTLFIRRPTDGQGAGERAPDHALPVHAKNAGPVASVTEAIDWDQTYRYAEASGDDNQIHLDPEFARSVGLPGIIVHGMCTLAFASRAVIAEACGNEPDRLRRLAARYTRPVMPGQSITTNIWEAGERNGRRVYVFEVVNQEKKAVIQDGLAEVAP
jgi:acyl dehydratase